MSSKEQPPQDNSSDQNEENSNPGIDLGKDSIEISKTRLQELMDSGKSKKEAMQIAADEARAEATEKNDAKVAEILSRKKTGVIKSRIQELVADKNNKMNREEATIKAWQEFDGETAGTSGGEGDTNMKSEKPTPEQDAALLAEIAAESKEKAKADAAADAIRAAEIAEQAAADVLARQAALKNTIDQTLSETKDVTDPTAVNLNDLKIADPVNAKGETYTIDGETVTLGEKTIVDGKEGFNATNLTTGEPQFVEADKVANVAEKQQNSLHEAYKFRFDFSDEELAVLENDPNYSRLSAGERRFVMESLTKATLEEVDELAESRFQEELSKKGWLGRQKSNMFKETEMADVKKRLFEEIRVGGLEKHKKMINSLIDRTFIMDTPMIENEKGDLEIQYSSSFADKLQDKPEAQTAMRAFNQAATALQNIPPEWESRSATPDQKKAAKAAKELYDTEMMRCSNLLDGDTQETKDALRESLKAVEAKVDLNRLMNAHPENEKMLSDLYRRSAGAPDENKGKTMIKDFFSTDRKGFYMALGAGTRVAGKYMQVINYATAPAIAGVLGFFKGIGKANKKMQENEAQMRRGGENKLTGKNQKAGVMNTLVGTDFAMETSMTSISTEKDSRGHKGYMEKINDIMERMEKANETGNAQEAAFYRTMLMNRIAYARERSKTGKISFGTKENRVGNQMAFLSAVDKAETLAITSDPEAQKIYDERMTRLMEATYDKQDDAEWNARMKYKAKFALKNAFIGGLFGAIGYGVADYLAGDVPPPGTAGGKGIAEAVRDNTRVSMDTPNPGPLSGGKDIGKFFPGNDPATMDPLSPFSRGDTGYGLGDYVDRHDMNMTPPYETGEIDPTAPVSAMESDYVIKPVKIDFSAKGSIETIRQLKEQLAEQYKGVDAAKIPPSVKDLLDSDPTKLAQKFGFYKPGDVNESAMIMKGSTLEIDSAGNLNYHHVGKDEYHILEFSDGQKSYSYDEKMFDYNGKTVPKAAINYPKLPTEDEYIENVGSNNIETKADEWINNESTPDEKVAPTGNNQTNEAANQATDQAAQQQPPKEQIGRNVSRKYAPANRPSVRHGNLTAQNGYPTTGQTGGRNYYGTFRGKAWTPGSLSGMPAAPNPGDYSLANGYGQYRSPQGTFIRIENVNGKPFYYDTHSFDPMDSFDPKVNRNYTRLMEGTFEATDSLTGETIIDPKFQKMLGSNLAEEDIHTIPGPNATPDEKNYYKIVQEIYKRSGLEPREGEPTGIYLHEALQEIKNDGGNVKKLVDGLIEQQTPDATETTVKVAKKSKQIVDDVYR